MAEIRKVLFGLAGVGIGLALLDRMDSTEEKTEVKESFNAPDGERSQGSKKGLINQLKTNVSINPLEFSPMPFIAEKST